MGTKANPGKYDCYAELADDEPYFLLKATDEFGPEMAALWATLRNKEMVGAAQIFADLTVRARNRRIGEVQKIQEAFDCAQDMARHRIEKGGTRNPLLVED